MEGKTSVCLCCSEQPYSLCCEPYINGSVLPPTPEALMRSRFSAYVLANARYIIETTHPSTRHLQSKNEILKWARQNSWTSLHVIDVDSDVVVFKAFYIDEQNLENEHFECSKFAKLGEKWYYLSGKYPK